jgi:glycogen debranching enzyme
VTPREESVLREAIVLARATLQGNIWRPRIGDEDEPRTVILAGRGKFDALWARDGCYSSLGALAIGRDDAVRGTLAALLDHQREDGLIPRRIGKDSTEWAAVLYALGVRRRRQPRFDTIDRESPSHLLGWSGVHCPDTNLLVPIVARALLERTGDGAFIERHRPRLERALAWLSTQLRDGLVDQEPISDWKDTADRGRRPFYDQALYFGALEAMAAIAARLGDAARERALGEEAATLAARARAAYWDERRGFFRDSEVSDAFSPDGNLLAIALGLASAAETARIFERCDALLARSPLLPATDPPYPKARVPWVVRAVGLLHYHGGFAWPWQDCLLAIAAQRAGDRARALRSLLAVAALASRDGGFFEVYEGTPPAVVSRTFYASEPGFSWSSGLFLRAAWEMGFDVGG